MTVSAVLLLAALSQGPGGGFAADVAGPGDLHVAVVLDDSGSMGEGMPGTRGTKMDAAKAALRGVFAALPPGARVGLFALNTSSSSPGGGYELLPIAEPDPGAVDRVLNNIRADGGTPLGERLEQATAALQTLRAARQYGDYRLLIVTDGEVSDADRLEAAVPRALGAGLTVDVIGVAMAGDHTLATRVDRYRRADDPAALRAALEEVLAESTGSSDAGDESDYDLIAPLPDGAAAVALTALADTSSADPGGVEEADVASGGPPNRPLPPPAPSPGPAPGAVPEADVDFGGGACCCLVPLAAVAVGGFLGFRLLRGGGGRRR